MVCMASLLEDKSQGVHLVQLCAKYRQESATLSPYHQHQMINEAASLKVKGRSAIQLPLDHTFTLQKWDVC